MKANFIIGRKQIVLASLVCLLGIAVYINWQFTGTTEQLTTNGAGIDKTENYGDAKLVNNENSSDFFETARLNQKKANDTATETVKSVLSNSKLSLKEKEAATAKAVEIAKQIESQGKIENLIKAKGFEDCVVYLDGDKANVVVKSKGLTAAQVAQIKDIILSQSNVNVDNITITEVK